MKIGSLNDVLIFSRPLVVVAAAAAGQETQAGATIFRPATHDELNSQLRLTKCLSDRSREPIDFLWLIGAQQADRLIAPRPSAADPAEPP